MNKIFGSIDLHSSAVLGLIALIVGAMAAGLFAQSEGKSMSAEPTVTQGPQSYQTPETAMKDWPTSACRIARAMIEKYGEPDRFSADTLVWYNNAPWQKTVVYGEAWPHLAGLPDKDYLEQTIGYQVPNDKVDVLKRFDTRLDVNQAAGELSSRSESERMNFLALNLADEIVNDRRSVEEARDFYRETVQLSESGKSSRYLEGFLYEVRVDKSSDMDEPSQ